MLTIKSLFNVALTVTAISSIGVGMQHMYKMGEKINDTSQTVHSTKVVQKVIKGAPYSVDGPYAASGGRGKVIEVMGPGMEYGAPASEFMADVNKVRNTLNHFQMGFKKTVFDPSVQAAADMLGANANAIIMSQKQMDTVANKSVQLLNDSKDKITKVGYGMDM